MSEQTVRKPNLVHIGTSGWHYDHWKGPFYPKGLPADDLLAYYADHFQTVEINNTFYKLPEVKTLTEWRLTVPSGFIFAVKASRYITHRKKLKDPEEPVANFMERIAVLEDKLGPILFQLPPHWNFNSQRLESFLETLPAQHKYAFEFRDPSWFDDEAYSILEEHDAAFCIYHLAGRLSPKKTTSNLVYVRLHGPVGTYEGRYGAEGLEGWAATLSEWAEQGKQVYCYFDNDEAGYATQDARQLLAMMKKQNSSSS